MMYSFQAIRWNWSQLSVYITVAVASEVFWAHWSTMFPAVDDIRKSPDIGVNMVESLVP
jgi:hypothetical protein